MALIPGTLPSDTCYGTPQDLLELYAQYLDVPAFALSSKVVFGTSSAGLTSDVIWIDTGSALPASATRPIMKITVSSSGFLDYIQNYINQASSADAIVGADFILFSDTSDSGATKKSLVSAIAALAVPAAGSVTPAQLSQPLTLVAAVATASGTVIDFTGIPSWAKRITMSLSSVSLNGTSPIEIRLGISSGIVATGYVGVAFYAVNAATGNTGLSTGFFFDAAQLATDTRSGTAIFSSLGNNTWSGIGNFGATTSVRFNSFGGIVPLGGVLDRIRLTTQSGDTFDGGTMNIIYEG